MSDETRNPGEDQLLDDLLLGDAPDPEWIVRYVDDPDRLGAEERAAVESYLASSPRARDEVAVLRRFAATASGPRALRRAPPVRRRALRVALPLAAAAAAIVAALLLATGRRGPPGTEPDTQIARVPESPVVPPPHAPEPPPAPVPEVPAPAPQASPVTPAPPEPSPRAPAPERVAPAPPPDEPIYVALAEAEYVPPWDLEPRERMPGEVRGEGRAPVLTGLAPDHVAQTSAARPLLLWHASRIPETGDWILYVADSEAIDPLIQRSLPRPERAGVQYIELDADLEPGREYQWSVAWRPDPRNPAADVLAQGWVRRIPVSDELRVQLASRPAAEHAALYARAGLWYDALAEVDLVHRRFPAEDGPRRALAQLLASAGLGELDLSQW
jgi:hypothetical protein